MTAFWDIVLCSLTEVDNHFVSEVLTASIIRVMSKPHVNLDRTSGDLARVRLNFLALYITQHYYFINNWNRVLAYKLHQFLCFKTLHSKTTM
jgi:hypothetical protein